METSSEIFQLAWQRRSLKGSGAQVGICLFYSFLILVCWEVESTVSEACQSVTPVLERTACC